MPDALKIFPIWCAVYIHHPMAKEALNLIMSLATPRSIVSEGEHNEITKKINHFVWSKNDSLFSNGLR